MESQVDFPVPRGPKRKKLLPAGGRIRRFLTVLMIRIFKEMPRRVKKNIPVVAISAA
jgi:hypothetical protein